MKKILIVAFWVLNLCACKTGANDDTVLPTSNVEIPEIGEYFSFDTNIVPDNFKYDYKTNQWEWKFGTNIKLELTPSAFGRLRFNKDGTYEFLDLKKSGTYRQDKTTKKLVFTGYMADSEGYYQISRGWCKLIISAVDKNGTVLSIVYEKKSAYPQPEVSKPNGNLTGTIVSMLSTTSADYMDVTTGKILKSHSNTSFPITGYSKFSVSIYKKNSLDLGEIYPVVEIKDAEGNLTKKFERTWQSADRWDIGNYWYGMLSPDGSKLALVGEYVRHSGFLDPNYVTPYPMISVIDINAGNEIYKLALDKSGNNWGPGWTATGELVMPRKGGGINILDASLRNIRTIYTKNVAEARMNQFGKVLFKEGTGIYTMDANGSNIAPVKNGTNNLTFTKMFDLGWSPDGKSMAFVVEEYLNHYNIVLVNPDSQQIIFLADSKGDPYQLRSPFLNWK